MYECMCECLEHSAGVVVGGLVLVAQALGLARRPSLARAMYVCMCAVCMYMCSMPCMYVTADPSRTVPSVRLTMGSKGMYSSCCTRSREGRSTAFKVRVSSAGNDNNKGLG